MKFYVTGEDAEDAGPLATDSPGESRKFEVTRSTLLAKVPVVGGNNFRIEWQLDGETMWIGEDSLSVKITMNRSLTMLCSWHVLESTVRGNVRTDWEHYDRILQGKWTEWAARSLTD